MGVSEINENILDIIFSLFFLVTLTLKSNLGYF